MQTTYRSAMPPKPYTPQPLLPLARLPGPPTAPGWYWFKGDVAEWEMLFEVQLIDGKLHMMKFYADHVPVIDARGYWRGPVPPSSGPGSR